MPKVIAVVGTKGGQGKTTTAANLGAYLSDLGKKVLLFDADSQPSLSEYFQLKEPISQYGLIDVFLKPSIIESAICETEIGPDIVLSNDANRVIDQILAQQGINDAIYRLRGALHNKIEHLGYDYVIIDCPGHNNIIHQAAIYAAEIILCPVTPDSISFREFPRGTLTMIKRIERNMEDISFDWPNLAPVYCVVNRMKPTIDGKANEKALKQGLTGIYEQLTSQTTDPELSPMEQNDAKKLLEEHDFMLKTGVTTLSTSIPDHTVYREATTYGLPVHRLETSKKLNNARNIMRKIVLELPLGIEPTAFAQADPIMEGAE